MEPAYSGSNPATLTYDPLGRLQTETTSSGAVTRFLYDGDQLVGEYGVSGSILNRCVTGPGTDEPVTWYSGSGTSSRAWYAADNAGSVLATADQNANATATYDYGPYGEPITSAGAPAWGGSRYRYTGQIEIPGAQVYDYKARVYDPGMGRFYQTDPAGYASDVNLYAYATNDPVNFSDPSGAIFGSDTVDLGGGCFLNEDFSEAVSEDEDGITIVYGYNSYGVSGSCRGFSSLGRNQGAGGGGGGGRPNPPAPQSNFKLPPCGNGTAAKIADWADKISVGTGAVAVTSGALGLITAPSGAGFVGFEAVAALSGGASALASGVGAVAHFANGDYVGAALDAGGIIGGFAAGKLAGGAIASTRTFNNLTASQARQVNLLKNATGTTVGAASSLYSCSR